MYNGYVEKRLPNDWYRPFDSKNPKSPSVKQVANQFSEVFAIGDVNKKTVQSALKVAQEALPAFNFFQSPGQNLEDYRDGDKRHYEVHVCILGCMAFHGPDAELLYCRVCKNPRFSKCKHCRDKPYESCSPFCITPGRVDVHALHTRIPINIAFYR